MLKSSDDEEEDEKGKEKKKEKVESRESRVEMVVKKGYRRERREGCEMRDKGRVC